MKRSSKFVLWFLSGFAALVIIAIASFVVWRVNLAYDVNAKLQAIRATGLPTSGAELNAYYPAVPDNENAALVITQVFTLMRNYPDGRSNETARLKFPSRGQRLTVEQKRLFAGYVEMNAAALAKMREALKLPESRYPVDYTPGPNTDISHLGKLHNLAKIVGYESVLAGESGDTSNAVTAIENLVGMAHTLDEEPDIIGQLVRIGLIVSAEQSLENCLNICSLSESELTELSLAFSASDKTNLMARALIGDRAIHIPIFIRVNWNATDAKELVEGSQQAGGFSTPMLDFWLIRKPRFFQVAGFWQRDLLCFLKVMETYIALDSLSPPRSLASTDGLEKTNNEFERKHYYLSKLLAGALPNLMIKEAKNLAYLRTATAAIAVERFRLTHGRLPEKLDELVPQFLPAGPIDPFSGQSLHYHRLAKGYVIYSVGSDGDDGGREKPADWKSTDKTTFDLTFTVER